MKALRIGGVLLVVLFAVGLSACAKKTEQVAATTEEENPATTPEEQSVEPPAPPAAEPSSKPATKPRTRTPTPSPPSTPATPAAETRTISLPAGATFDVELTTPVHTGKSNVGDAVEGTLAQPLTSADGYVIANSGALIRGEIAELTRASRAKSEEDRASVKFAFTSLETVDGEKTLNATVTNSEGKLAAKSTSTRDALIIGGSTVAGAIIGKVAGKSTKSTVIGAVGGAVLGTGAVMAAKGYELEIPAGSKVSLRVEEPITIVAK